MCDHLHDSTSRYDAARKVLSFLLVCTMCGTEKLAETLEYEPRPVWTTPGVIDAFTQDVLPRSMERFGGPHPEGRQPAAARP